MGLVSIQSSPSLPPSLYSYLSSTLLQIEGVSYRGRVMVEIDMNLGELPSTKVEEIKIADQKRITPFLRRRKYKLFASFFSATCVYPTDAPVEFEVSIGESQLDGCLGN